MHWYGGLWRRQLKTYTHFFVLNEVSQKRLQRLGFTNVTVTGVSAPLVRTWDGRPKLKIANVSGVSAEIVEGKGKFLCPPR